jgi:ribonuclease HII
MLEIPDTNKEYVIGCDECGTGSWAGPLVVVGVRAPRDWTLEGLKDSKKLSRKKREAMLLPLMKLVQNNIIDYYLAERPNTYIDRVGISVALRECYAEVFKSLYCEDCLLIADGNLKFDELAIDGYDVLSLVKADTKIQTVMAASIIAKCWRDDKMKQLHFKYPQYNFLKNVGYGTATHLKAIAEHGHCDLHRFSYAPMRHMKI